MRHTRIRHTMWLSDHWDDARVSHYVPQSAVHLLFLFGEKVMAQFFLKDTGNVSFSSASEASHSYSFRAPVMTARQYACKSKVKTKYTKVFFPRFSKMCHINLKNL